MSEYKDELDVLTSYIIQSNALLVLEYIGTIDELETYPPIRHLRSRFFILTYHGLNDIHY